jgi:hypothetical protein
MIGPRLLYAAAALFTGAGVALHLAPAASSAPPAVSPVPAPNQVRAAPVPAEASDYDTIIASNVFASTRAPPAERLVPEDLKRDTQTVAPRPAKPAEPPTRLYGITKGTGGAVALIDADPKIPGAEVYRVGDRVRDARITAISDSTVMLSRPTGPLVLRLPASEGERR